MIHVTLLNPSLDLIYTVHDASKSTYVDLPARLFPAGKGVNVAKVVAELGEHVILHSLMPQDDLVQFSRYCESHSIEHRPFTVSGSVRINTTIFDEVTRSTTHYNSAGARLSTQIQDGFERELTRAFTENEQWLFCGSLPLGIDTDFYCRMVKVCHDKGAKALLDTRGVALELGIRQTPEVISPNEEELEFLFSEPVEGIQHLALKGKRLIDSGIEQVFITLGEDGVLALNDHECILCRPPEIEVVDTVGCGDAFLAGVAVARERGFSFHETCRLAVACGTSNAAHLGPGEVSADQVWHFMEKVSIISI